MRRQLPLSRPKSHRTRPTRTTASTARHHILAPGPSAARPPLITHRHAPTAALHCRVAPTAPLRPDDNLPSLLESVLRGRLFRLRPAVLPQKPRLGSRLGLRAARLRVRSSRRVFRAYFERPQYRYRDATVAGLQALGAQIEWSSPSLLAVDVDGPSAQQVADYLQEQEGAGRLMYETGKTA